MQNQDPNTVHTVEVLGGTSTPRRRNRMILSTVLALSLGGGTIATAVALDNGAEPFTAPPAAAAQQLDDPAPEREAEAPDDRAAEDQAEVDGEASNEVPEAAEEAEAAEAVSEPARTEPAPVDPNEDVPPPPVDLPECVDEEWVPSAEEVASHNEQNAELSAALTAAGVEHEMIVDDFGFTYPEYDWNDVVAQVVVASYYQAIDGEFMDIVGEGEEWDGDGWDEEEWTPDAEYLETMRAENALLTDALDAAGIEYEIVVDGDFEWVEWDYDDAAANAVVDSVYAELYGWDDAPSEAEIYEDDGWFEGDEWLEDDWYGDCVWTPNPEDVAMWNQEAADLSAALTAAGIDHELVESPEGNWVEYDYEDPAATEVVDAYYEVIYGPYEDGEWSEEDYEAEYEAEIAAQTEAFDALEAALIEAGVEYERSGEPGCEHFVVDLDDPAAMTVLAAQ